MAAKKAKQRARFERSLECSTAKIKNAPSNSWKRWFEHADNRLRLNRLGHALDQARDALGDTQELLMELAREFPVEASVLGEVPQPRRDGFSRVRVGRRDCIIIGGVGA